MSQARMEMESVASAKGSPRMLLGRKLGILGGLSLRLGWFEKKGRLVCICILTGCQGRASGFDE